jgi:hypothetical protein
MGRNTRDADEPLGDGDAPVSRSGPQSGHSGMLPRPALRPTKRPAFDLHRFAEEAVVRDRAPTITDEAATEEARITSLLMDSSPPGPESASAPELAVQVSDVNALSIDEQTALLQAHMAPLSRVPSIARSLASFGSLVEDPKTAYVLGFVDGLLPLETIIEVCGLPEIDVLRILDRMIELGVIVFRKR